MQHEGGRPRVNGLFCEVPEAVAGWENRYSQSGRRSLVLVGDAVVPDGATAEMELYSGPTAAPPKVQFPSGTRLRLVRAGDIHTTSIVEVIS